MEKINLNREKVTIEDLGSYREVINLTLKINDMSNEYSYLLVFTLNENIIILFFFFFFFFFFFKFYI